MPATSNRDLDEVRGDIAPAFALYLPQQGRVVYRDNLTPAERHAAAAALGLPQHQQDAAVTAIDRKLSAAAVPRVPSPRGPVGEE